MYSTALLTIHIYRRGHTCMHRLLDAIAIAIHDHWYVYIQYVQSMCVGESVWSWGYREHRVDRGPQKFRAWCQGTQGNVWVWVWVCMLAHLVLWSQGTSALVRVTGGERSVGLKNITTATASHNPIPSHPIQELCATWLACSPWGAEATDQALSAYSLCQLWLWVCGRGASSALKERLAHFGRRRCELCRRTPTVCVYLCVQWCQCESFMRNSVGRTSYF